MSPESWIALVAQTIILFVAIVAAAVRIERRVTRIETKVEHLEEDVLAIPGISRNLAKLEGKNST